MLDWLLSLLNNPLRSNIRRTHLAPFSPISTVDHLAYGLVFSLPWALLLTLEHLLYCYCLLLFVLFPRLQRTHLDLGPLAR